MAQRRMIAKTIIDSDAFLDMPQSTQLLYLHLNFRADDDGFLNNAKSIMRNIGCKDDDLKILAAKKFIIPFESGVVVIKHWKIHNYIAKDRYNPTKYKNELSMLNLDENNSYSLTGKQLEPPYTECIQDVDNLETQVRLGKVRLGKDRENDPTKSTYDLNGIDIPINTTTHKQLITEYGENTILDYYERVHDYSQSADKKYKDYAATARNWIKRDIQQGKGPVKQKSVIEKVSCPVCGFTMTATGCNICGLDRCDLDNQDVVDEFRTDYERRTKK